MTDLKRFKPMHKAYVRRMSTVRTFCVAALLGSAAQAGAWEEFEARCLVPMENFGTPISDGLSMVSGGQDYAMFVGNMIGLTIYDGTESPEGCSGQGVERTVPATGQKISTRQEIIEKAIGHFDDEIADNRYEFVEEIQDIYQDVTFQTRILRTKNWREPVLEVRLEIWPSHGNVTVRETDLES